MLRGIKTLLERSAIYLAILCTIGITILSLIEVPPSPVEVSYTDKIFHIIAYFCLTVLWLYGLAKKEKIQSKILFVLAGCFIYGIIIEVLQTTITTYRTASYLDILANSVGIVLAVLAFQLMEKKNHSI